MTDDELKAKLLEIGRDRLIDWKQGALMSPRDSTKFYVGDRITTWYPWYRRAWYWLMLKLRIHRPLVVTEVDYAKGVVTVERR